MRELDDHWPQFLAHAFSGFAVGERTRGRTRQQDDLFAEVPEDERTRNSTFWKWSRSTARTPGGGEGDREASVTRPWGVAACASSISSSPRPVAGRAARAGRRRGRRDQRRNRRRPPGSGGATFAERPLLDLRARERSCPRGGLPPGPYVMEGARSARCAPGAGCAVGHRVARHQSDGRKITRRSARGMRGKRGPRIRAGRASSASEAPQTSRGGRRGGEASDELGQALQNLHRSADASTGPMVPWSSEPRRAAASAISSKPGRREPRHRSVHRDLHARGRKTCSIAASLAGDRAGLARDYRGEDPFDYVRCRPSRTLQSSASPNSSGSPRTPGRSQCARPTGGREVRRGREQLAQAGNHSSDLSSASPLDDRQWRIAETAYLTAWPICAPAWRATAFGRRGALARRRRPREIDDARLHARARTHRRGPRRSARRAGRGSHRALPRTRGPRRRDRRHRCFSIAGASRAEAVDVRSQTGAA